MKQQSPMEFLGFFVPPELAAAVRRLAERDQRTVSAVLRRLVASALRFEGDEVPRR